MKFKSIEMSSESTGFLQEVIHCKGIDLEGNEWTWQIYYPIDLIKNIYGPLQILELQQTIDPIDTASDWSKEIIEEAIQAGFVPDEIQDKYLICDYTKRVL